MKSKNSRSCGKTPGVAPLHQRCTGSGFQDSSLLGFSRFLTNRIGYGLQFYSSFRIRIRIFKFYCFGIWRQNIHEKNFWKDLKDVM